MSFVRLTRPDGSPVAINPDEILRAAPVPASGALMGPLSTGSRVVFRNQSHQDVRELLEALRKKLGLSSHDCREIETGLMKSAT